MTRKPLHLLHNFPFSFEPDVFAVQLVVMNGPFMGIKHYSLLTDGAEYRSDMSKLQEDLASSV